MSIDLSEDATIGDLDADVDGAPSHPFEVDTRAGAVVIANETGERTLPVEAAYAFLSDLEMAVDIAGQYKRSGDESDDDREESR